jgi:dTDP-glucose 4,6-dehydratase
VKGRVLVTGGAGFIGSHVAAHLKQQGWGVHILDRFSYAARFRNLAGVISEARLWVGDLKEWDVCVGLAKFGFDAVVHLASNTHVDHAIRNPVVFTRDNVLGTAQLLHALQLHCPAARVVAYSTDEVYGPTPDGERFTESAPFRPSNAYSASKVGIEGLASSYFVTHGMNISVVRPCNTYGRRQHPEKAIPRFVRQAMRGEPLTVHGDGSGARDWLHTGDHATGVEAVLEHGKAGEAYNLAAGDEHTDLAIARGVLNTLGKSEAGRIEFITQRPGHDRRYWMAGDKLRALGWAPMMPFSIGFRDTVLWNAEHQDWWERDDLSLSECLNGPDEEAAAVAV